MCEVLRVGLFNGTGAEHDVGGARNTVDVTYFSASTMLSAGMPVAACTSTSALAANQTQRGGRTPHHLNQPARNHR
jgi:hypothetical protein